MSIKIVLIPFYTVLLGNDLPISIEKPAIFLVKRELQIREIQNRKLQGLPVPRNYVVFCDPP